MAAERDLSDMRHLMVLLGLWFYRGDPQNGLMKTFQFLRMAQFVSTVLLWLCSGLLIGWRLFLSRAYSGAVIGCCYVAVQWLIVSATAEQLEEFVELLKGVLLRNSEFDIFHGIMDPTWKFARLFCVYCISLILVVFNLPVLYNFLVSLTGLGKPLDVSPAVEGLLPEEENLFFWLILLYQVIGNTVGIMFIGGNVCLGVLSINYTRVAIQMLNTKVRSWANSSQSSQELFLKEIISDHTTLIKLSKLLNSFLSSAAFVQVFASTLTMTFFLYGSWQLLMMTQSGRNVEQEINNLWEDSSSLVHLISSTHKLALNMNTILLSRQAGSQFLFCLNNSVGLAGIVYVYCYLGEQLHTESTVLYYSICSIPWYSKSIRTRKCLVTILSQAQRPLQIHYKGWTLRMAAFTQMINTTYSYFMLLTSLE